MEFDNLVVKNISYLRARDPSILACNIRPQLAEIRTNLLDEFGEVTCQPAQKKDDQNENLRVYLRIKNGYDFKDLYEIDGNTLTSKVPPGSNFLRNMKDGDIMKKKYVFTKIFDPEMTQRDLFDYVVKPKILEFINGQNSTLLTYGASGSGKTFTVIGTDEQPGVVPRSLEYLFRTLPTLSKSPAAKPSPAGHVTILNDNDCKKEKVLCRSLLNASTSSMDRTHHIKTYLAMQQRLSTEPVAELDGHTDVDIGVWISFAEIYNEQIYDLLQLDPPRGQQRPKLRLGMSNGHTYIKNLTSVNVTSGQQAYQILQYGIHNLNYASTQLNKHSSRSHSIFTIKLVQISIVDGGNHISCFHFCDLAGSERSSKTLNVGDRLRESNNINSSLLVLGRCISAVRNSQKQNDHKLVPFRESKLTQLFQKALSGGEDIAMIVNISPSREMFDESQHVLNFSAVAKDIVIEQKPEVAHKNKNRFSMLVEENEDTEQFDEEDYQNAIAMLQRELETQKIDLELDQQINLQYIREEYEKLLTSAEERAAERSKREAALYELRLSHMKGRYEKVIAELKQQAVIEIESSDEEDPDKENTHNNSQLNNMGMNELRQTLTEGIKYSKERDMQYKLVVEENNQLKSKIYKLEEELDLLKTEMTKRLQETYKMTDAADDSGQNSEAEGSNEEDV